MNIFYLNKDPIQAAKEMCDKHVVKMILESAQLLSTAHRVIDGDVYADKKKLYKMTHKNHPCSKWVCRSGYNYVWLWNHMDALMKEYTNRYGKNHATERLRWPLYRCPNNIDHNAAFALQPHDSFTDPPQCMPDYCKQKDTVLAYQNYYIAEKSGFAKWNHSEIPKWWKKEKIDGYTEA